MFLLASCVFSASQVSADDPRFQDWLQLRDDGVVRQQRDFSCGLAALATLLELQFGLAVSEQSLLEELLLIDERDVANAGVSFAALVALANQRSIHGFGVSVNYTTLRKLRQPAIVALSVNGRDHFSVLKRIDETGNVWLADPSWGNRRLAEWQFAPMFLFPSDKGVGRNSGGRLLLFQATTQAKDLDGSNPERAAIQSQSVGNGWRMSIPPSLVRSSK